MTKQAHPSPQPQSTKSPQKRPRRFFVHIDRKPDVQSARQELPVCMHEQEIVEAIHANDVVLITGATGTGKTTQVPQFLVEDGFGDERSPHAKGIIAVTQPRRVAAIACAKRVAFEMNSRLGDVVGYQIRHESKIGSETKVKFVTDGVLLREVEDDVLLRKYSAIIIDEVHERSLNTDLLLSFLSRTTVLRRSTSDLDALKVIIMSATLEVDGVFSGDGALFPNAPVVKVPSRQYPVTVHFAKKTVENYVQEAYEKTSKIHRRLPQGGVLVFLSGRQEVEELCARLRQDFEHRKIQIKDSDEPPITMKVLPFYALQSDTLQRKVFDDFGEQVRKVVVATNIAETSVTVPGVSYVVDSGRVKEKVYRGSGGGLLSAFKVVWVSQASAEQRTGRAGRTGPGHCYRLYSSAVYDQQFDKFREAEIRRVPADAIVLRLRAMGIRHVEKFPFATKPDMEEVKDAERLLTDLGALWTEDRVVSLTDEYEDAEGRNGSVILGVTSIGRDLAKLPVPPRFGRMLLFAKRNVQSVPYVCRIAAILSVGTVLDRTSGNWRELHRAFAHARSDLLTELAAVCAVEHAGYSGAMEGRRGAEKGGRNVGAMREICESFSLHYKCITEALAIADQLEELMGGQVRRAGLDRADRKTEDAIICALLCGFGDRVARRMTRHEAAELGIIPRKQKIAFLAHGTKSAVFLESNSSVQLDSGVEFVVFSDLVVANRQQMRLENKSNERDDYEEGEEKGCETSKEESEEERIVMRGASVIEAGWLIEHATTQCRFARATSKSATTAEYNETAGCVTQSVAVSYGESWTLGCTRVAIDRLHAMHERGKEFSPPDWAYVVFAKALIQGRVRNDVRLCGVCNETEVRMISQCLKRHGVVSARGLCAAVGAHGGDWMGRVVGAVAKKSERSGNEARWNGAVRNMVEEGGGGGETRAGVGKHQ